MSKQKYTDQELTDAERLFKSLEHAYGGRNLSNQQILMYSVIGSKITWEEHRMLQQLYC